MLTIFPLSLFDPLKPFWSTKTRCSKSVERRLNRTRVGNLLGINYHGWSCLCSYAHSWYVCFVISFINMALSQYINHSNRLKFGNIYLFRTWFIYIYIYFYHLINSLNSIQIFHHIIIANEKVILDYFTFCYSCTLTYSLLRNFQEFHKSLEHWCTNSNNKDN
jgi:hypothetical protein